MKHLSSVTHIFLMLCMLLSMLALSPVHPVHAGITCTVTSTSDDGSFGTLRDCIAAANSNPNSTINFSVTGTIILTAGQLNIGNNMTISGPGASQLTINGGGASRIFDIGTSITVTISGLTVTNGSETTDGGGIRNQGNLTLDAMAITANTTTGAGSRGGGIFNQSVLTINNSTISSNTAKRDGGGIYSEVSTTLVLNNMVVTGNSTSEAGGHGGGVAVFSRDVNPSTMSMDDSTVSVNTAHTNGGGIAFVSAIPGSGSFGTLTITDSVLNGNQVTYNIGGRGGGISIDMLTTATLTNTTISSNTAPDNGGGMAVLGSTVSINNVTIASNTGLQGGGVFLNNTISGTTSTLNAVNSLIGDNVATAGYMPAPDCYAQAGNVLNSQDYNLIENTALCTITGAPTHDIYGSDPILGALTNNGGPTMTQALLTGSPAIDSADNTTCATTDQRGVFPPRDGDNNGSSICDMSAFERKSNTTTTFRSVETYDGWILESAENSTKGGTFDKTATTFRLGDDAADKQYRAILHFNTASLPDTATIIKVTLKIKKQGLAGTDPFTILGGLKVDMRKPYFGSAIGLVIGDFEATAGKSAVATFGATPISNWYSAVLSAAGRVYVNKTGTTQFRLHFATGDNDNNGADYMKFFSGDYATISVRPTLIIEYYIP